MKRNSIFRLVIFSTAMNFHLNTNSMNYIKNAFNTITQKTKAGWEWIKEKTFAKTSTPETDLSKTISKRPTDKKQISIQDTIPSEHTPHHGSKTIIKGEASQHDLQIIDEKIKTIMKKIKKKDRGRNKKNNKRATQQEIKELHALYKKKKTITNGKGMPQNFNQFFRQEWSQENPTQQLKSYNKQTRQPTHKNYNRPIETKATDYKKDTFQETTTYPTTKNSNWDLPQKSAASKKKEKDLIEERINAILIPHTRSDSVTPLPISNNLPKNNSEPLTQKSLQNPSSTSSAITKP
jgi:hypothetical protein